MQLKKRGKTLVVILGVAAGATLATLFISEKGRKVGKELLEKVSISKKDKTSAIKPRLELLNDSEFIFI